MNLAKIIGEQAGGPERTNASGRPAFGGLHRTPAHGCMPPGRGLRLPMQTGGERIDVPPKPEGLPTR
jgi:hypothetical protein